jgi:hypothetical protein
MNKNWLRIATIAVACAWASPALGDDATLTCDQPHEVDKYQVLRRMTLDLAGRVPSIEEYAALDVDETIPEETTLALIQSDEFRTLMRRYHETLFWPNVSNVRLNNVDTQLGTRDYAPEGVLLITSLGTSKTLRGVSGAGCGDFQQTSFGADFRPTNVQTVNGALQEGWRMVTPYWDTSTQIKVCAFDAQETKVSDDGAPCNSMAGRGKKECGCGPNLSFCYGPSSVSVNPIRESLREQLARSVDQVTSGGKPYTDLVKSKLADEDGYISFWRRNLAPNVSISQTYNAPASTEPISNKNWGDTSWTSFDRKGLHAGVVTLPAYLLRFQTDRGRANRFRIDFMCESFVPPEQPDTTGCDPGAADLTDRCTCRYCHQKLEPMAAWFSRFTEAGSSQMLDDDGFPAYNENCKKSSSFCNRFYVTKGDRAGWLLQFEFANAHPEYEEHANAGPGGFADEIIDDGVFAQCAVKRTFSYLVKRDIRAQGATTDELELLTTLVKSFQDNGYSFPMLVHDIVSLSAYRRAR